MLFQTKTRRHLAQLVTEAVQAALNKININPEQHQAHATIHQTIQVPHNTTTSGTKRGQQCWTVRHLVISSRMCH